MKRLTFYVVLMSSIGSLLLGGVAQAGVNDFSFDSFAGEYTLSRDQDGRSRMRIVETFTARFPDFNQNKGVTRAIPETYNGHSVQVEVESLTRNGQKEPIYGKTSQNDNLLVATGDNTYLRGQQTYVLTYSVRDVIKEFSDQQEFYWDTIGTQSTQSFGSVRAVIRLDPSVRELFTGRATCYQGPQGATTVCDELNQDDASVTFAAHDGLGPRENITMVLGFQAGAFAGYVAPPTSPVASILAMLAGVCLAAGVVGVSILRFKKGRDAPGRGIIIPEYLPPAASLSLAGDVSGQTSRVTAAQLVSLAVLHKARIVETKQAAKFLQPEKSVFTIELLSVDLEPSERQLADVLFDEVAVGETFTFDSSNVVVGQALQAYQVSGREAALTDGYRQKVTGGGWWIALSIVGLLLAFVAFGVSLSGTTGGFPEMAITVLPFLGFSLVIYCSLVGSSIRPLTQKGRELKDYLTGLRQYIELAEKDRLQMLQSPTGADRSPIDTTDGAQLVRLYERVLPYAVLFGQEKEWAKQLTIYYQDQGVTPGWYQGMDGFHAGLFISSLSQFSSTTTTFSSPVESSGSGFSSGGGFSGGGGGGGGFGGR